MAFIQQIPEWNAKGIEPPESLRNNGWKKKVKPPDEYFNWLHNRTSETIKELQQKAGEVKKVNGQLPDANGNVNVDTSKLATKEELSSASTYIQQEMNDLEQTVGVHKTEDATNSKKGHVQLVDDVNGNSTSLVPTQNAVRKKIEQTDYKVTKSSKDSEGIFRTVEYRRINDNTLAVRSVLSGGTSPTYTTRTITYYGSNGTTEEKKVIKTLRYDADGDLISEV